MLNSAMTLAAPPTPPPGIDFLLLPGFSMMALAAALEPLRVANRLAGAPLYAWRILSADGAAVAASNGMTVLADAALDAPTTAGRLVVCAGFEPQRHWTARLRTQLRRRARGEAALGALDTGSFFLGWAGLLDGYRATTHWESLESFREAFPRVEVTQHLFEIDRGRFTCAGGTAALDLVLHLIREEHGHQLAAAVSEQFIHAPIREPTESQRTTAAARAGIGHPRLARALGFMESRLEDPATSAEIAAAAGLSPRQLERLFRARLGRSPTRWYRELRLERAKALLQYSTLSVAAVAVACGFTSTAHFSRSYRDWAGKPPRAER